MTTMVERMVIAIRDEAKTFRHPVRLYVEDEARWRWEDANPDKDGHLDGPAGIDWEMESWKILVRAVLQAMREPTDVMCEAGDTALETAGSTASSQHPWQAMIDAALKEGE